MEELRLSAETERWGDLEAWLEEKLENADCPPKALFQVCLAAEEVFVNIASYAYGGSTGEARIVLDISDDHVMTLSFEDSGIQYDPLKKADPDVTLSAEERNIGGLGIFLVKKNMDDVSYAYRDSKNILTMKKKLF